MLPNDTASDLKALDGAIDCTFEAISKLIDGQNMVITMRTLPMSTLAKSEERFMQAIQIIRELREEIATVRDTIERERG